MVHCFDWRKENCPECGGSGVRMGCSGELECFDCGGEGQWNASCADCGDERRLNGDGLCASCCSLVEVEVLKCGGVLA